MPPSPPPTVTPLPPAPLRSLANNEADYVAVVEDWASALPDFGDQVAAVGENVYENAQSAYGDAATATTQAALATTNGAAQVTLAAAQVTLATAQAVAAAASAASAVNAPGTSATSTASLTIGTGARSPDLVQAGKAFSLGQNVVIASTASPSNRMTGIITAFNSGTGAMTVNVTYTEGSGTFAAWTVSLSAAGNFLSAAGPVTLAVGTQTSAVSGLTITETWNGSGVTFPAALQVTVTDTASAAASQLLNLKVGSTDMLTVTKGGQLNAVGIVTTSDEARLGTGGARLSSLSTAAWTGSGTFGTADLFIGRNAAATLRLGAAAAASPVAQTLTVQSVLAGTSNTAGANFSLAGSQGTGTGAGGSLLFKVAPAGSTGSAQNALQTALTIASDKVADFAVNPTVAGLTLSPSFVVIGAPVNVSGMNAVAKTGLIGEELFIAVAGYVQGSGGAIAAVMASTNNGASYVALGQLQASSNGTFNYATVHLVGLRTGNLGGSMSGSTTNATPDNSRIPYWIAGAPINAVKIDFNGINASDGIITFYQK
jgi:hypothetical protein